MCDNDGRWAREWKPKLRGISNLGDVWTISHGKRESVDDKRVGSLIAGLLEDYPILEKVLFAINRHTFVMF